MDKFTCRCVSSILLGRHLGVELLGHVVTLVKLSVELPDCFPVYLIFYSKHLSPSVVGSLGDRFLVSSSVCSGWAGAVSFAHQPSVLSIVPSNW